MKWTTQRNRRSALLGWIFGARRPAHSLSPSKRTLKQAVNGALFRVEAESRLKLGALWAAHDLVFCSEWGAPHSIPNLTYSYFRPEAPTQTLERLHYGKKKVAV